MNPLEKVASRTTRSSCGHCRRRWTLSCIWWTRLAFKEWGWRNYRTHRSFPPIGLERHMRSLVRPCPQSRLIYVIKFRGASKVLNLKCVMWSYFSTAGVAQQSLILESRSMQSCFVKIIHDVNYDAIHITLHCPSRLTRNRQYLWKSYQSMTSMRDKRVSVNF